MIKRLLLLALLVLMSARVSAQQIIPGSQAVGASSASQTDCVRNSNCAYWNVQAIPSLTLQITGTMTSMTLTFEGSADNQTWFSILPIKLSTGAFATTTTTTGQYAIFNTGLVGIRARCTTYSSGAVNVNAFRGYATGTAKLFDLSLITGTLAANHGGTGFSSYAVGDILSADTTTTLAKVPAVATGQVFASAGANTLPAYTATPTVTSATSSIPNLTTTSVDGIVLTNPTASTVSVQQQNSPRIRLIGTGWTTNAGGSSQAPDWKIENQPVAGSGSTVKTNLIFARSLNGGAYTNILTLAASGQVNVDGGGDLITASAVNIQWSGQTKLASSANGKLQVNNTLGTNAGLELNYGTAAPTVTSCGTGSVTAHSSNIGGEVTATGATTCTVTFGAPNWSFTPFCTVVDETTLAALRISAISVSAFTVTGLTSSDKFMWTCVGGSI